MVRTAVLATAALLAVPALARAQALSAPYPSGNEGAFYFPTGRGPTINIVEWDANSMPEIFQRSEQLPLTSEEIARLSKAGFTPAQLVKMLEERRCACDASAEGLIKLKEQGVAQEVLSAISLHALKPNRALDVLVTLDFTGKGVPATRPGTTGSGGTPRESIFYFFVDDGAVTRVFSADVGAFMNRAFTHETMVDRSDLLLTREVRRVQLPGRVPLKTYGKHTLLVTSSARPTITHPSELNAAEKKRAQSFTFDYPRASLQSVCRLNAAFKRDPVLAHRWQFAGSRFECEWD